MYNANRCAIELHAGRRIGQLVFAKIVQATMNPYTGKYQGQRWQPVLKFIWMSNTIIRDVMDKLFPERFC